MSAKEAGQRLQQARQERGLDLAEAARATHIRSRFLRALEEGELDLLPSAAQVRGFLRTYAEYLNVDPKEIFGLLKPAEASLPVPSPTVGSTQEPELKETQTAFGAIGAQLRQRRESLELSPLEVEGSIHIPEHYLQRLERGEFDSFPSPTQARGMLSNYAEFLGLESEAVLLNYAEALQQRFQAKQAARPASTPRARPKLVFRMPEWLAPLLSRDILFGGVAGLVLLLFVVWSIGRIAAARAGQTPEPTAPPLTGLLLGTPIPTGGAAIGTGESINLLEQQTPTPGFLGEATIQVGDFSNISLRLISLQRTWMRITVDGRIEFEGRTLPGQTYSFAGVSQILLLTGNGSALRAFLNEQDLGILGIYGEVVQVVFTREGAATPTLSPTPTIDPNILTATANAALTPSATPQPTATPSPQPSPTVDGAGGSP